MRIEQLSKSQLLPSGSVAGASHFGIIFSSMPAPNTSHARIVGTKLSNWAVCLSHLWLNSLQQDIKGNKSFLCAGKTLTILRKNAIFTGLFVNFMTPGQKKFSLTLFLIFITGLMPPTPAWLYGAEKRAEARLAPGIPDLTKKKRRQRVKG